MFDVYISTIRGLYVLGKYECMYRVKYSLKTIGLQDLKSKITPKGMQIMAYISSVENTKEIQSYIFFGHIS